MQVDLKSLEETHTRGLIKRPSDKNVIPGKWVYNIENKPNRSLVKHNARYVAKVFKQIEDIGYGEIIAPTNKPENFRLILSLAAKENFTFRQRDVKSAYLHPTIKDEIYLKQPKVFEKLNKKGNHFIYRLNKSV